MCEVVFSARDRDTGTAPALGPRKDRPGKAAHRIAQEIELAFNSVPQHISAPSVLDRQLDVPLSFASFTLSSRAI